MTPKHLLDYLISRRLETYFFLKKDKYKEMALNTTLAIVILGSMLTTLLMMYLDGRLFDNKRTKATYIKNMILSAMISAFAVYMFSDTPVLTGGASAAVSNLENLRFVDGEQILTGMPNF
jgi:hypothetical protein